MVSAAARAGRWRRQTRPNRALRIWAALKTTGRCGYRRLIEHYECEAYTVPRACFVNPLTTRAEVDALVVLTIHYARVVQCEGET